MNCIFWTFYITWLAFSLYCTTLPLISCSKVYAISANTIQLIPPHISWPKVALTFRVLETLLASSHKSRFSEWETKIIDIRNRACLWRHRQVRANCTRSESSPCHGMGERALKDKPTDRLCWPSYSVTRQLGEDLQFTTSSARHRIVQFRSMTNNRNHVPHRRIVTHCLRLRNILTYLLTYLLTGSSQTSTVINTVSPVDRTSRYLQQ